MSMVHYNDVTMSTMASQITSLSTVYSTVYSGTDQRKHQSSVSLAFVRGIHRWPANSPHKGPVTRKMFPFDLIPFPQLYYNTKNYITLVQKSTKLCMLFRIVVLYVRNWFTFIHLNYFIDTQLFCADWGIMINQCTLNPGYWQNTETYSTI